MLTFLNKPEEVKPDSIQPKTVAAWVQLKAGISKNSKAYSIRAASSTKAVQSGISIFNVVKNPANNWSQGSDTLESYYYKPVEEISRKNFLRPSQSLTVSMFSLEEQLHMMQQQIVALQDQLRGATTHTPMQSADDTATLALHSMGTRPHYDWSPSEGLAELMNLDAPLINTSELLSDSERKTIIEAYQPMAHLEYKPPATIPNAGRAMNKATYRPLDILCHELLVTSEVHTILTWNDIITCFRDVRKPLIHLGASMTQARNNIAFRVINPSFSIKSSIEVNYTLPLDEFQNALFQ
ncbi:hypothetical protein [Parasitella parasitica]|uniref:Uncharacterized protein n=1 Tax=Parasitella parasitica TaxID=35722 RepID=A0A0B7N6J5_9FUNG|nr:hypothetical protein [Parasitella parasitica]